MCCLYRIVDRIVCQLQTCRHMETHSQCVLQYVIKQFAVSTIVSICGWTDQSSTSHPLHRQLNRTENVHHCTPNLGLMFGVISALLINVIKARRRLLLSLYLDFYPLFLSLFLSSLHIAIIIISLIILLLIGCRSLSVQSSTDHQFHSLVRDLFTRHLIT